MTRKLVRRFVLGAAMSAGVLLIVYATLQLPLVRAALLERARAYTLREFGVVVDASSLHYGLLSRSIELRNVRFAAAAGEPPFLQAESVRLVLDRSLFRGNLAIDKLELVGPRVTVVRHANGTTNLPSGRSTSSDAPLLDLGMVTLSALTIAIADESTGREAALGPLDLSIDASPSGSRPGAFGPSPFSVRLPAPGLGDIEPGAATQTRQTITVSGTLAGQLAFNGVRVTIPDLRMDAPEGQIVLRGFVDIGGRNPGLDLHGRLDADLARAAPLIQASLIPSGASADSAGIRGALELVVTARGSVASPTLDLAATGREVAYGPLQSVSISAKSSVEGNRLRLHQLDVSSPAGSLSASGEIAVPGTRQEPSRLAVEWTDVDMDRALVSAGYAPPASIGARASGRAELRLDSTAASVADVLSELAAEASLKLQPSRDAAPRGARLALGGQAELLLKDGSWSVPTLVDGQQFDGIARGNNQRTLWSGAQRLDARRKHATASGRCRRGGLRIERRWRGDSRAGTGAA